MTEKRVWEKCLGLGVRFMCLSAICSSAILAFSLLGCQATPAEDVIVPKAELEEKLTEAAVVEAEDMGKPLRELLEAPEQVSFEVISDDGVSRVFADRAEVCLPETDRAGTARLVRDDFTDADTEAWTKAFFGDGEVWKYEVKVMTKADWLAEWESFQDAGEQMRQNAACEWDEEDEAWFQDRSDYFLKQMEAAPEEAPERKKESVDYCLELRGDEEKGGYYAFEISGVVPGGEAVLALMNTEGSGTSADFVRIGNGLAYRADDSQNRKDEELPNLCSYSEEEAIALLKEVIDQIEPENRLMVSGIEPLYEWKPGTSRAKEEKPNQYLGYEITFARSVGDLIENGTDYEGTGVEQTLDSEGNVISEGELAVEPFGYEKIVGRVTDDGIIEFYWRNKMAEGELLEESVALLPFEKIQSVMEENFFMTMGGGNCQLEKKITRIQLGLMAARTPNENNTYTLLPVWDVYTVWEAEDAYWENEADTLTVNAIDGSIVNRNYRY